jgi:uncharacterized protein
MHFFHIILLFVISALVSSFGTLVGFGGGVFMVPILVIVFKIPINIAVGSVIFALFPAAVISSYFNIKEKKVDYRAGITLEIPTMVGTVIGALLTKILPLKLVEIGFSIIIFLVGIFNVKTAGDVEQVNRKESIFYKLNSIGPGIIRRTKYGAYKMSFLLSGLFGMVSGIIAGFLGIGGGFMKTPIMVNVFNLHPEVATSTALFMIVFTSLTGSISHYILGNIHFTYASPIVLGFIVGAFAGNFWGIKIKGKSLKIYIGVGLILAALSVLIYSIHTF